MVQRVHIQPRRRPTAVLIRIPDAPVCAHCRNLIAGEVVLTRKGYSHPSCAAVAP